MSASAPKTQQLQQDLQNELTSANQLLRLISIELQKIKSFTMAGGEFEENIKQNVSIIGDLAKIQQINIKDLPPLKRLQPQLDMTQETNQSYQQHDSFRNSMDDSQYSSAKKRANRPPTDEKFLKHREGS